MSKENDIYRDVGHTIQDLLQMILGDKFEVWSTGTINPDYYEGHKKLGKTGGLELTITLKDYDPHPTFEQVNNYFKEIAKLHE